MNWKGILSWLKSFFVKVPAYNYLSQFSILQGFTKHELFLFYQIVQERHFKEGEYVYREQFPLAVIYLIGEGSIEIKENEDVITLGKNQIIGIINMYNEHRRKGEAKAVTDSTLYAISHLDLQSFINKNPRTGVKLLNNICRTLCRDLQSRNQFISE